MKVQRTILIADDAALNRKVLHDYFHEEFQTLLAEDGEQAIEILKAYGDALDLVLLDIRMPKKSGFEVLEYIQEHNLRGRIPVIVITGSSDDKDELKAYSLGAADIIRKPFAPQIVMKRAGNMIELFEQRRIIELQLALTTKELEDARAFDKLTGLLNMQQFVQQAEAKLQEAGGNKSDYLLLYSNICNFKYYNTRFGIRAGDEMLQMIAGQIRQFVADDVNARFGNDHFVTLTKNSDVMNAIRILHERFEQRYGQIGIALKTGIYRIKNEDTQIAAACDLAKIACDSIRMSKAAYCIYDDKMERSVTMSNYVIQNLDRAILNHDIKVYYQPVQRTISNEQCGMEALARWIDPTIGFLSPADFIPALEENHLITKLDLYMLREICREMKEAERRGDPLIPVSFNLSRYDFSECDIFAEVEAIVEEYGVSRSFLSIEITESTIMDDPERLKTEICRFREGGYQVWMDDFGSGYSSLNLLKDFEFDEIKLDMQFLSAFTDKSKKIIESMILMAKKLGIQTLAEGVETEEQFRFLRDIGCEKAQGYLFSRPLPGNQLQQHCIDQKVKIEQAKWRSYYDQVGKQNFITDRSFALVEYDGAKFTYWHVNDVFREVWESLGIPDIETVYRFVNDPESSIGKALRSFAASCRVGGGKQELVYPVHGEPVRLLAECLVEQDGYAVFEIEITKLV